MSGSDASLLPFADLGQQGRRYVTDVVTPELIEEVMGEPAVAHPIRTYVGFNSEPLYPTGRAELALAELDRTGAFDRSYLLLVSPTGTGWVDHTLIETAEFLTRGDIATCCVQYGRYPSFLSVQKVALGRSQFRLLLWGVNQRLAERPPDRRPRVLVFGESLGAWTSSDVVMFQGIEGFDHYGIDRALWVGLPWLAKWSRMGMTRGASAMVPEGTVGVFDRHEQLAELTDTQRARLRATILSHDNDPIAVMGPELIVRPPAWLADSQRGRGVPEQMRWRPLITFVQTAMDAANAMVSVPGDFGSFGHDYRADMVRFVRDAYALPAASDAQVARIEAVLRSLELERAERIKAQHGHAAPPPPAHRAVDNDALAGVPLRHQPYPRGPLAPRTTSTSARPNRSPRSGAGGCPEARGSGQSGAGGAGQRAARGVTAVEERPELREDERAELERLRVEVAALRAQQGQPAVSGGEGAAEGARRAGRQRWRTLVAVVLIVLGCVLAPLAGVAVWARNQVTNTDRYVATVTPLASDPAVQQAITDQITAQVFTYIDIQALTTQVAGRAERPRGGPRAASPGRRGAAGVGRPGRQRRAGLCPHPGRADRPEPGVRGRLDPGQPGGA